MALLIGAAAVAAPALAQDPQSKPYYPPSGFDLSAIDAKTTPGDDFFQYANGAYLTRAVIPADRATVSRRLEMTDRMEADLHDLLQQAAQGVVEEPTDSRGKAGAFYISFLDEARIDRVGLAAIAPELDAIRAAAGPSDLARLMGQNAYDFYPAIVSTSIDSDLKAPGTYAITLNQSGLGLPDRDYYLKPEFAAQREAYTTYATKLLTQLGWRPQRIGDEAGRV